MTDATGPAGPRPPSGAAGLGALLRGWRERALLSQEQLAERAGLNVRTVRRLESGVAARPQSSTLRLLIDALDLDEPDQEQLRAATLGVADGSGSPDGDPDGRLDAAPTGRGGPVRPRQLPAPPPGFTGRIPEMADLDRTRDGDAVVITAIDGMAGIGKTALALTAAHRLAGDFPDGQLFLDLHGYTEGMAPVRPGAALDRLLRSLGVPGEQIPEHDEDRAARYRDRLAGRKVLVVLDNAGSEAQVAPLLPGSPGCRVLVTSRRRLTGLDHTHTVSLDVLPVPDAVALFTEVAGIDPAGDPAGDADTTAVAEVVELCGRLPLALRIAAARLRSRPSWTLVHLRDRLRDRRERLDELEAGQRSVTAALDVSYRHLHPDLRRAYRLCSLHPGADFDLQAAAALLDVPLRRSERLLDELLDVHLLQELLPGRYRFHDLVRAHATSTTGDAEPAPEQQAALDRLFDHYCHATSAAMDLLYPFERERRPSAPPARTPVPELLSPADATAWLDTELPNLLATARHAADRGAPEPTLHLSSALHRHLRTRARYHDSEELHQLALTVAQRHGQGVGEADALLGLGYFTLMRGRLEQARSTFHRALETARAHDHRTGEVDAHTGLGRIMRLQGQYGPAATHFEQALEIIAGTPHPSGEVDTLTGLGWVHVEQGRPATADFERALAVARATGNQAGELHALRSLGSVHRREGRHPQAIDCFARSLAVSRAAGNPIGELSAMISLGWAYRQQGRLDQAAHAYRQADERAQRLGNPNWEFEVCEGMGRLDAATGHPARALSRHHRALTIATDLGQVSDQARAHDGIAHAHRALGDAAQARQHWQTALAILTDIGTDVTEDEQVTAATIRAGLDELGPDPAVPDPIGPDPIGTDLPGG